MWVKDVEVDLLFRFGSLQSPILPCGLVSRYLDLRVEVQWQKEAFDSGRLVAKCPGCSFLVLCNEQEDQGVPGRTGGVPLMNPGDRI